MSDPPLARILIADDEPLFLMTTAALLRKAGYECTCAADGKTALEALAREPFDLVLSDLKMPGNLDLELLQEGRDRWPRTPLIVITGAPSLPTAIASVRLGISDYLLKPVKYEDLLVSVRRALAGGVRARADAEGGLGFREVEGGSSGRAAHDELIGESQPMRELREIIDRLAATDANVLITGESGTGKEVVARAIHCRSFRSARHLQVIDCTAIPEPLFESVLFGHAKGSFTGAIKDQTGLLSQADRGTAFLDEIGELTAPLQAKLLRVIQEQVFTPVGKTTPVKLDTRFICATNRDLELEVQAGRFRRDLFYRLAVVHIDLPPLRERGDDVRLLAEHFLHSLQTPGHPRKKLSPAAFALLQRYRWPGNVRELRNAIERGMALARGEWIEPADLPVPVRRAAEADSATGATAEGRSGDSPATDPRSPSRTDALQAAERDYLAALLRNHSGNVAQAARQAGLSRQGLHRLLKKYGVEAAEYRP